MDWYVAVLKKYAVFDGRARRMEYWMFVLFNFLIGAALGIVDGMVSRAADTNLTVLGSLYGLAVLLPSIGVSIRRLHDTGRSGWWLLLALIPLIGAIILIIWYVQDSQPGPNQYGPNPKSEYGVAPAPSYAPGPSYTAAPPAAGPSGSPPVDTGWTANAAPAAWLADPTGRHELRYWDGQQWTDNVSDGGVTSKEPL